MEKIPCNFCGGDAHKTVDEIVVKNGLKKVSADTIHYRCERCGRVTTRKEDRLNSASELHHQEDKAFADRRIHRTRKKNSDKIPTTIQQKMGNE